MTKLNDRGLKRAARRLKRKAKQIEQAKASQELTGKIVTYDPQRGQEITTMDGPLPRLNSPAAIEIADMSLALLAGRARGVINLGLSTYARVLQEGQAQGGISPSEAAQAALSPEMLQLAGVVGGAIGPQVPLVQLINAPGLAELVGIQGQIASASPVLELKTLNQESAPQAQSSSPTATTIQEGIPSRLSPPLEGEAEGGVG